MKKVCIVHYNTPKLTECLIKSINKHVSGAEIYIFDNSDKEPFTAKFDNVTILDNTKGQIIDFEKWLQEYPNRIKSSGKINGYGSAKHSISIEKCIEIIDDNFVLLDSDVLIKKDFSDLYNKSYLYCAETVVQPSSTIKRILPFICFINVNMCKEKGIHYFNDNYMHGLSNTNVNKDADKYDTGAAFYIYGNKFPHKDIKTDEYITHYKGGSWEIVHNKKYGTHISVDKWLTSNYKLWNNNGNKKVIYTCISGEYDILKDPIYINTDYDYICFTDQHFESNVWDIRPIPKELNNLSQVKKQRFIKIMPHVYLKNYDFSIWVDGNVNILNDINEYTITNCKKEDGTIIIGKHPSRNCIYDEMKACASLKKDSMEIMLPQINKYKEEGFPKNYGLPQTCIIFRYHNEKDCVKVMEAWWNELKNGSHRDQLSFSYALWKNKSTKMHYVDKSLFNCKWFKQNSTHKDKINYKQNKNKNNSFMNYY